MIKVFFPVMAVGTPENDCVVLEVFPTVTGIPLFQSTQSQHTQNNPARNSRSCLANAPSVSSGLISSERNENCRMGPASRVIENTNHNCRQTFSYINPKLARHPWTDSAEFAELWSDIPSENINHDWTDQEQTASENDSALISNFETDSGHDSSQGTCVSSNHPCTASGDFVEQWSDIPSEFESSRNLCRDRRELLNQNNRISVSNVAADSKYDSSVISWDFSKHPWAAYKEFVVLWSDIPNNFDASQNRSNDRGKLMNKNNRISNVADLKYDSSVITWDSSKNSWTASKDFVVLWSDIPSDEFYSSQNLSNDQGEWMNQNYRSSVSNVAADTKYDLSVISWDFSKHPWTASKDFVVLWSDIPSDKFASQNQSEDQNGGQYLSDHSVFFGKSCNDSENLTEVSIIAQDDSISNKNYFNGPEKNFTCCELFFEGCCSFENFAMNFKNSIYYLVVMSLLSLIPISATCMGFAHCGTGSCPANMAVTHLVYASGISGLFFTGTHIWHHFLEGPRKEDIGRGVKAFQALTAILLLIEMILFYSMSPSFENSENYCDETFYYFTFYTNIAAAGIVFLSVLLKYTSLKHLVDNLNF